MKHRFLPLLAAALLAIPTLAQTTVKKVVLQGFWWDYQHNQYRAHWADYLTDLAPRLKEMGIDAVWIPPASKANGGTNSVGYGPFDAYDLGDKYQKNTTRTRLGTKDELLRLVAVLHANGIEVVQDVVLNHADGAGTAGGLGGLDPNSYSTSANGGFKNFRYSCFGTPVPETADNAAAYLARQGRWPKNFTNFHAHAGHNTTSGDFATTVFGPDFCYGDDGGTDGYGPSTNATYNPPQAAGYSRNQARSWLQWMKKQTGFDGIRWDAVKHFSYAAQQDWTYNLKYLTGFANGGQAMLSTGEFVGSKSEIDAYCQAVNSRNGGSEFATGTFDFGLRGAIYNMVSAGGNYDLSRIPAEQQDQRVAFYSSTNTYVHRTAPFVNSHDTFRPTFSPTGNYTGWNSSQELGAHIEPNDPRLSAAYAVAFAVDGNPHVYFEDLFNIGYLGNRFTHQPADAASLPVRSDLANIIWCHQHLNFKAGAYFVRYQSADHLVIERGGRAVIGINDNFATWQANTVATGFAQGTLLKDYSGANGAMTVTVGAGGQVSIRTAPCNGTATLGRRGYSVWAPVGQDNSTYTPPRAARTTQEWELADDLGDANCRSLGQGGRLPDNSRVWRVAGKVFAQSGTAVSYSLFPENPATNANALTISLFDANGNALNSATGTTGISGSYTPTASQWLTIKVRNATATQPGQRAYAQLTYQAPPVANTLLPANAPAPRVAVWTAAAGTANALDCRNYQEGRTPDPTVDVLIPGDVSPQPTVAAGQYFLTRKLTLEAGSTLTVQRGATAQLFGDLVQNGTLAGDGSWLLTGLARTPQLLGGSGPLTFSKLEIKNDSADVALGADMIVRDTLTLTKARLVLDSYNLTLGTAIILGGSDASYVFTTSTPASGGECRRQASPGVAIAFPVGSAAGYAPLVLTPPLSAVLGLRTFEGVFTLGNGGAPYPQANQFVNRTWALTSSVAGSSRPATGEFHWSQGDENPGFQRSQSAVYYNFNSTWQRSTVTPVPALGSGPYTGTYVPVPYSAYMAVGNFTVLATRTATEPTLLAIAPNPTAGRVSLSNLSGTATLSLSLTSVLGQQLMPTTTGSLPQVQAQLNAILANAAAGVYVITVQAGSQTQHLRLVHE